MAEGADNIIEFSGHNKIREKKAFFIPAATQYLKVEAPGKKVLDIGCGSGEWSYLAAAYGAKSVDGFDIQEEMVQLAKRTTSQFSTVNMRVGDVMKMPYDDNSFDLAMSLYVTVMLPPKACVNHFTELYRVLAPGGKAIVINFSNPAFDTLHVAKGADRSEVEKEINKKLASLSMNPPNDEIRSAFNDMKEVLLVTFALNKDGRLFKVTDIGQLTDGQNIWIRSAALVTNNYFYSDQYFQDEIKTAGLCIDQMENYFTEERRIAYNNANPHDEIDKEMIERPPFLMYHLSKPLQSN